MRLAVIPARGGSKRIPRKNIKPFAGRPMIAYAIGAAQQSGLFDQVVVSTDDAEIADVARGLGAAVPFVREAGLADDFAGTEEVIADAVRRCIALGWDASQVCCIYPGVPLLRPADLAGGLALLEQGQCDFAMAAAEFPSRIQRALRRARDGRLTPFQPEHVDTRTQDLEPAFYDVGQFYWGGRDAWLAGRSLHGNTAGWILPGWRAVDIDTPEDWRRAELVYRSLQDDGATA